MPYHVENLLSSKSNKVRKRQVRKSLTVMLFSSSALSNQEIQSQQLFGELFIEFFLVILNRQRLVVNVEVIFLTLRVSKNYFAECRRFV